jgi:C1A family cysteine protease
MNKVLSLTTLFLLYVSFISATAPLESGLENYSFEQYLKDFNFEYSSTEEYNKRKNIFEAELTRVKQHNAKNSSWKESINRFSVMTAAEKKSSFGRLKINKPKYLNNLKSQQTELPKDFVVQPIDKLPSHVDWRLKDVVSAVKDQGHCGSCW